MKCLLLADQLPDFHHVPVAVEVFGSSARLRALCHSWCYFVLLRAVSGEGNPWQGTGGDGMNRRRLACAISNKKPRIKSEVPTSVDPHHPADGVNGNQDATKVVSTSDCPNSVASRCFMVRHTRSGAGCAECFGPCCIGFRAGSHSATACTASPMACF